MNDEKPKAVYDKAHRLRELRDELVDLTSKINELLEELHPDQVQVMKWWMSAMLLAGTLDLCHDEETHEKSLQKLISEIESSLSDE